MKKEDIEFLKELQHELNTQDNCGQAEPKYWGIMERKTVYVPEDCGDEVMFFLDGCDENFTMDSLIQYIQENYYDEMTTGERSEWKDLLESEPTPWEMKNFLEDNVIIPCVRYVDVEEQDVLSQTTGCFLTKKAAQEYIDRFGYNHSSPRTYAMTAYRNFELEHLLNILKTIDLDDVDEFFDAKRDEFYSRMEPGRLLWGTVQSVNKTGIIINFKYTEGFLPASEMSWNPDDKPGDVVKKGDEICVVVLEYDCETREFKLGHKQLMYHKE